MSDKMDMYREKVQDMVGEEVGTIYGPATVVELHATKVEEYIFFYSEEEGNFTVSLKEFEDVFV